ncbi:hypothetical protein P691DRAFT_769552 [Macrolepiota fuliginosa MF-IS2]|uniref:Uncharacterized protein n=1 Tax=Macrolepiota fuliginosa MF-IS2 TaxID=1400762 RepID=A0A9P5WVX2_9AGAR|nr:hypothetical protein P691DRAFT_769552 [Macrolepiota fuliginosa MF-IS2]
MARKPKGKKSDNVPSVAFTPSDTTCCFLDMMNQDIHVQSKFEIEHLYSISEAWCKVILDDFSTMCFQPYTVPPTPPAEQMISQWPSPIPFSDCPPKHEPTPLSVEAEPEPLTLFQKFPHIDELFPASDSFLNIVNWYEDNFCPQKDMEECTLFTHNEDTLMEPSTPIHVLNEVATQTLVPVHMEAPPAQKPPAQPQSTGSSKHLKQPFFVTCSPSWCQFYIEMPAPPSANLSLPNLVQSANCALTQAKFALHINSAHISPNDITCATALVPTTFNPNIVKATLPTGLAGAHMTIPASQSSIKIVDVPYFKPRTTEPPTGTKLFFL